MSERSQSQAPQFPNLAAALAHVQANLPGVRKGETAKVPTKTGGSYSYTYANLADIHRAVLPLLGNAGLAWLCRPTVNPDGQWVLAYSLLHESGDRIDGDYRLPPGGSPQEQGSAITYARRYAFCAVTGVVPDDEDDDGNSAQRHYERDPWDVASAQRPDRQQRDHGNDRPPNRPTPSRDEVIANAHAAINRAGSLRDINRITATITAREQEGVITADDGKSLRTAVNARHAKVTATEQAAAQQQPEPAEATR